ncbi:S-layer protein domain-containing protein [Methanolobus vulcani]|uniref:PGF-pre-PGF domain-containing protein n=1 Tax=Methanolobus vulcani TaxID=38026 RepID=A0A7Z8KPL8_9EURY|nr:S-layer protein domain-containing protein [Methanolobus vulcani]TQD26130.1 PGF-pre-PGF domain-containing protein [Methanolobus vulcani]
MLFNKNVSIITIILLSFFILIQNPVDAAVLTVSPEGADYSSIQDAINDANNGDTILVYPGTYHENVDVGKQLNIISTGGAELTHVIATSADNHVFNVTADGVMIDGFYVSGFTGYSKAGIYLDSSNSTLTNINAVNNTWGIYLDSCRNNTLAYNNVANNSYDGIILYYSSNNTLTNNIATSNKLGMRLYYSTNNALTDNTATNSSSGGIILFYSNNNILVKNTVKDNSDGIALTCSSDNSLVNNTAVDSSNDGIRLVSTCNNNILKENIISSNANRGIWVYYSFYNELVSNLVSNNGEYGIYVYSSLDNIIYNNLFKNTANYRIYEPLSYCPTINEWNVNKTAGTNIVGGPYLGGNYWARPDGKGFSQRCTDADGDGICDTRYSLYGSMYNIDYLPLASWSIGDVMPVASFSANVTSGYNPLSVALTDISINADAYEWDFGDGSISTDKNPIHVFTNVGTYSVSLTAFNGSKFDIAIQTITVNEPVSNIPVASFTTDVVEGTVPLTVEFTDTSANSPTAWCWDFDNDGIIDSTDQNPVYTFTSIGSYDVTLKVTNSDGEDNSDVTTITVYPQTYYTGYRIWDENTGQSTTYTWDARSFSGFFYDLDSGLSSEIMTIHNINRSLGEGDIVYQTRPIETDFEHSDWVSYQLISFMAETYFAGYTDETEIDDVEEVSMLSSGQLSRILIDDSETISVNVSSYLKLEDGYSLNIIEIDTNGTSAYVTLSKDNINLDSAVVSEGDDYVYKLDLGDAEDVVTVAVHFNEIFIDNESKGVIIEGVFQIEDVYLDIESRDVFGNMEITAINSDLIEMENDANILLSKGSTANLMEDINILVADNNDLRLAPFVSVAENEKYELRGTIAEGSELLTWTPLNFEGFYYDIDEGIQTETLELKAISNRTIDDGDLIYTTIPASVEFEHSEWGYFQIMSFMAEKYFAGYADDTYIDGLDEVSLLSTGHLSKLLINDDDDSFLIYSDSSLIFEENYVLDITEINTSTNEILLTLTKDGEEIDSSIVSSSSDYVYSHDIGNNTNVPLIAVHFKDIIVAGEKKGVFIEGLFQISDNFVTFTDGDSFENMEITSYDYNSIVFKNEYSILLSKGAVINITDNIKFRVADSSDLRYYPFVMEGTSSIDDEVIIPEDDGESDTESSTTTSTSSGGSGGGGGGSGTTGEEIENIAYKDVLSEFVSKGDVTSYKFDNELNAIEYINFEASRNWGKIFSTIEMLNGRSALVDEDAPDIVYCNVNLWVGKSGFSSSDNIANPVIGFKVEKEWIEDNEIDVDTIKLCRYSNGEWNYLDNQKTGEDDKYLHFEASTPGFSPFAIVGNSVEKTVEEVELKATKSTIDDTFDENEVPAEQISKPKNWIAIGSLSILLIGGIVGYSIFRKRT